MKVGIIGAGNVGSATAFALVMRGVARKVVLIDANEARAKAEAADIAHASPFADASKIKAGTYEDLKGAEVVIITAGANQKPGEPRTALLERNVKIFENIIPQVVKNAPDCMLLITSNPVDIMTSVALKLSGFPKNAFSAAAPFWTAPAFVPCSDITSASLPSQSTAMCSENTATARF